MHVRDVLHHSVKKVSTADTVRGNHLTATCHMGSHSVTCHSINDSSITAACRFVRWYSTDMITRRRVWVCGDSLMTTPALSNVTHVFHMTAVYVLTRIHAHVLHVTIPTDPCCCLSDNAS